MKELKGIYPAIMTPFDAQGAVSETGLRKMVQHALEVGVNGFYVCGGGGEGLLLTVAERQQVLEIVLDAVKGKVPVIAHVGAFQIPDAIRLARHAGQAGADAVASMPPAYFYQPNLDGLVQFYRQVAEAAERPVLAYNIPGRIPINLDTRTFERLIRIPGVVGLKDSSGNLAQITLTAAIDDGKIIVFNGEDQVLWYGLMAGCVGGIGSTYPVMLKVFVDLYRAFLARDWDRGLELQRGINRTVRVLINFNTLAALKQILKWLDLDSGDPRLPNRSPHPRRRPPAQAGPGEDRLLQLEAWLIGRGAVRSVHSGRRQRSSSKVVGVTTSTALPPRKVGWYFHCFTASMVVAAANSVTLGSAGYKHEVLDRTFPPDGGFQNQRSFKSELE